MKEIQSIEGLLNAQNLRIAIAATRFNDFIVKNLVSGALDCLTRHGANPDALTLVRVPGAFELPLICQKLATSKRYDGILALGAVIRGATPHFEYVSAEASKGIAQVSLTYGVPIGFGLLTCDTIDQAIERAGSKAGNKGVEAALALIETIRVLEQI